MIIATSILLFYYADFNNDGGDYYDTPLYNSLYTPTQLVTMFALSHLLFFMQMPSNIKIKCNFERQTDCFVVFICFLLDKLVWKEERSTLSAKDGYE